MCACMCVCGCVRSYACASMYSHTRIRVNVCTCVHTHMQSLRLRKQLTHKACALRQASTSKAKHAMVSSAMLWCVHRDFTGIASAPSRKPRRKYTHSHACMCALVPTCSLHELPGPPSAAAGSRPRPPLLATSTLGSGPANHCRGIRR